jgi:tRNA/rRNA methyltransferase
MSWRTQLKVVLHQVRSPENLGAVARLLANFELSSLALSDPKAFYRPDAEKMAIRATSYLDSMQRYDSLDPALADCVYALGTTSRAPKGRPVLSPEEGIAHLAQAATRGKVALVFGGEKRGLSDEDLSRCQEVLAIPTGDTQPSMNLAQAAAVLLYLCAREEGPNGGATPPEPAPEVAGARLGTVAALETKMRDALLGAGFLNPQAPAHILDELLRTLTRGSLSQREAELWLAAFKQLGRARTP